MSGSYSDSHQHERNYEGTRDGGRGGSRGGRGPGNRESGGFRIRLSDNEMRSVRSIQEAFNLRSTVAVLGFAVRALGQMLEEGKLEELIAQHKSQSPKGGNRREDGSRRNRVEGDRDGSSRSAKPNPFARPTKPQTPAQEVNTQETDQEIEPNEKGSELALSEEQTTESASEQIPTENISNEDTNKTMGDKESPNSSSET